MVSEKSLTYKILLFVKGISMGVANKVPGVSGGAVAYVLDFYEELIYSFQKINRKAFGLLFQRGFKSFFSYINGSFLVYVVAGMVFSYFTVSKLLDYFLIHFELQVWALFFGMIVGSGIYLIKRYEGWKFKSYVSLCLGVLLGFALNFIDPSMENHNLWFVFFCGIIGVSGMTIPGLSGSYILMLMGNYVFLLVDTVNVFGHVITSLAVGNFEVLKDANTQHYLLILLVFTLGSVLGLIFLSQLLSFVLKKWSKIVNASIIGFIIGSLGTVWPWKHKIYLLKDGIPVLDKYQHKVVIGFEKYSPDITSSQNIGAIAFVLLGIGIVLGVDYFSNKEIKE